MRSFFASLVRFSLLFAALMSNGALSTEKIPNTIFEAFVELDALISPEEKKSFASAKEDIAITNSHMGLGTYIRNKWFRSGKSKLIGQMYRYGAESLDDMSSMLLSAYWRHLNKLPSQLERQGKCYRKWWSEQEENIRIAEKNGSSSYNSPSFSCIGVD